MFGDEDRDAVSQALIDAGFRVTRMATTGGFLRRGSTTFMIGVEDEKVDAAIQIIDNHCSLLLEPGVKRVTLFVLNVERYMQV